MSEKYVASEWRSVVRDRLMTHWHIAKSNPRKASLLIDSLGRWGVETYYPEIRKDGRPDGKLEPLFNTYVFCRFDQKSPEWQAIRWAPGLSYFLTEGDALAQIPESLIEYFKAKTRRWNEGAPRPRFHKGEAVAIVDGPFAGFEAIFSNYLTSRDRCMVLLSNVAGISAVEIPNLSIEKSGASWSGRFGLQSS